VIVIADFIKTEVSPVRPVHITLVNLITVSRLTAVSDENEKSAIVEPLRYVTPMSSVTPVCELGVGVGVIDAVTDGVVETVIEGVVVTETETEGVTDGVVPVDDGVVETVIDGVTDGVVPVDDGVVETVIDGVVVTETVIDGVTDGVVDGVVVMEDEGVGVGEPTNVCPLQIKLVVDSETL